MTFARPSNLATGSDGSAPRATQYLMRSTFRVTCFVPYRSGCGLYVPRISRNLASRAARTVAATIRYTGLCFSPQRCKRSLTVPAEGMAAARCAAFSLQL
eukprot:scaffold56211_cov48-Phaeocystis_antarctica.AAC.1